MNGIRSTVARPNTGSGPDPGASTLTSKHTSLESGNRRASTLRTRFDRISFVTVDRLLVQPHADKTGMFMALERREIPFHTNGAENDIRWQVTRLKV